MFAPFSFEFYLNYEVSIEIQGLSSPLIFILKFKDFQDACEPWTEVSTSYQVIIFRV